MVFSRHASLQRILLTRFGFSPCRMPRAGAGHTGCRMFQQFVFAVGSPALTLIILDGFDFFKSVHRQFRPSVIGIHGRQHFSVGLPFAWDFGGDRIAAFRFRAVAVRISSRGSWPSVSQRPLSGPRPSRSICSWLPRWGELTLTASHQSGKAAARSLPRMQSLTQRAHGRLAMVLFPDPFCPPDLMHQILRVPEHRNAIHRIKAQGDEKGTEQSRATDKEGARL